MQKCISDFSTQFLKAFAIPVLVNHLKFYKDVTGILQKSIVDPQQCNSENLLTHFASAMKKNLF